ncbi:hypothetical protein IJD34_03955 [bacterium]|nr:hypothetical protein [bacterium]
MPIKFNPGKSRSDCLKPKTFRKRNWPKYMEKIEAKKAEKAEEILQSASLERTPLRDCLDFSCEELGYFIGPKGERVRTIFPR